MGLPGINLYDCSKMYSSTIIQIDLPGSCLPFKGCVIINIVNNLENDPLRSNNLDPEALNLVHS